MSAANDSAPARAANPLPIHANLGRAWHTITDKPESRSSASSVRGRPKLRAWMTRSAVRSAAPAAAQTNGVDHGNGPIGQADCIRSFHSSSSLPMFLKEKSRLASSWPRSMARGRSPFSAQPLAS